MNPFSRHLLAITVLICLSQASCAYRFSNSYIEPPEGIESIAVEAIYDTSREVISHEQLWQQVQEAVIKDGHLQLKDRSEADALLRLHIMDANIAPAGESRQNGPNPDGKDPEVYGRNYPPHPNKMRPLTQAGQFKDSAQMRFVVLAEVVNLRTRAILHKKKYNVTTDRYYATYQGNTKNNWFLRYVEATDSAFNDASETLAAKIIQDVMVQ